MYNICVCFIVPHVHVNERLHSIDATTCTYVWLYSRTVDRLGLIIDKFMHTGLLYPWISCIDGCFIGMKSWVVVVLRSRRCSVAALWKKRLNLCVCT